MSVLSKAQTALTSGPAVRTPPAAWLVARCHVADVLFD